MAFLSFGVLPTDPGGPAAQRLLALSDRHAIDLYPPESNHLDGVAELRRPNVTFVGAYADSDMIGCGAVKTMEDDERYGEMKRLFVLEQCRGRGVATAIVEYLENCVLDKGIELVRLETGVRQPAALALYRRLGYVERPPFGGYRDDPLSVFMEKRLVVRRQDPRS